MAKGLAVCMVLCALVHLNSGAVIKEEERKAALLHKKFGHLQGEIDEWKRLGKPTELAIQQDNTTVTWLLIQLPEEPGIFSTNYEDNVFFYLFTRENPDGTKVEPTTEALSAAGWSPRRPTKIVTHGFTNTIESPMFVDLVPAILENGDYNVIGVDWGNLCGAPFYIEARNHVKGVGKEVAKLVDKLVLEGGLDLNELHVMGHSLGAHVAGNTGKHVTAGKIGRITGMDPAMPLFLLFKSDRLSKDDAELVDVVHTCGGLLGLEQAIGHVDFYPNGGSRPQPGCGLDLIGTCSHGRSYEYMAESAMEPGSFAARECASESSAETGACSNEAGGAMGLNLEFNTSGTGTYYLETASSFPYDLQFHSELEGSQVQKAQPAAATKLQ